jgi:hypothetical protein
MVALGDEVSIRFFFARFFIVYAKIITSTFALYGIDVTFNSNIKTSTAYSFSI